MNLGLQSGHISTYKPSPMAKICNLSNMYVTKKLSAPELSIVGTFEKTQV